MKQSQTSTSISPSVKGAPSYLSLALIKGALKPALLAVVAAIVTPAFGRLRPLSISRDAAWHPIKATNRASRTICR